MIHRSPYPDIDIPGVPVMDYMLERWSKYDTVPALINGLNGESLNFSELSNSVHRLAAGLTKLGVAKGDRVAIYKSNSPEFAVLFFAISMTGGISTTINPLYTVDEVKRQLNDTESRFLFTAPAFLDTAMEAAENTMIEEIIVLGESEGKIAFSSLLSKERNDPCVDINPQEELIAILYSSGTTGLPKGVMLSHYNFVTTLTQWRAIRPHREHDITIAIAPFFHIMGLIGLCYDLAGGCTVVTIPHFDLEQYLKLIERYRTTFLRVAPPIVLALAKHPMIDKYDLSSLIDIGSGGAPLSEEMTTSCAERLNCEVYQGCGMTETTASAFLIPDDSNMKHPSSVGIVLPNTEARIIDVVTKSDLGPNEQGEIWMRGPQIMKGYWNNHEATQATVDAEGWLATGDIGYVDEEGYVYIVDRIKELIKYKGYQVAPVELESILLTHPHINDAAVIPVSDDEAGEIPKAFVVLKNENGDAEEIKQYVAKRVAPYKKIRKIEFIDEIPKSASGKILRRVLIERDQ